jgi:putative transposase
MPSRNVLKIDIPDSYYHVYARGASRQEIFLDDADYWYFLELFRRYLSPEEILDSARMPYDKLHDDVELLCYCLMPNHFHLLLYQVNEHAMQRLMRGVMTAYSRYFNKKYKRSGSLFESRYKASRISSDEYLMRITRYIHLNPKKWRNYPYSSLVHYTEGNDADWLREQRILGLFSSKSAYGEFVADYESVKESLTLVKNELAGGE